MKKSLISMNNEKVFKKVLKNGLTVLIKQNNNLSKVSIFMWYKVGAKYEDVTMKGYSHIIEHMMFKGTKNLSERDITEMTHKLAGKCNASTTHDYTYYDFQFPYNQWYECLEILSDCMTNCEFKQDYIDSEFKTVFNELKKGTDEYSQSLMRKLVSAIFYSEPYHYEVIGLMQDVINVNIKKLNQFYKNFYIPNNAVLVIVGNVDKNESLKKIEKIFQNNKKKKIKKRDFVIEEDVCSKTINLYRPVNEPEVQLAFTIPGFGTLENNTFDVISDLLFSNSQSRLSKKLIDENYLVTEIYSMKLDLFLKDVFFIGFKPIDINNNDMIISIINKEIQNIIDNGISDLEKQKIINNAKLNYYDLLCDNSKQNELIGKFFLATNNQNFLFEFLTQDFSNIEKQIKEVLNKYYRPILINKGFLIPISDQEEPLLKEMHIKSEIQEIGVITTTRKTKSSKPKYAKQIKIKPIKIPKISRANSLILKNDLKIIYFKNDKVPLINVEILMMVNSGYEPDDLPGIYNFLINLIFKGVTEKSQALNDRLEQLGTKINFSCDSIKLTMLSDKMEESLNIINEMINNPIFHDKEIEKIRNIIISEINEFWNDSANISEHLVKNKIYKNSYNCKSILGTKESINKINKQNLIDFYKKHITPKGTTIVIVGDIKHYDIKQVIEKIFGKWQGQVIQSVAYPKINLTDIHEINYDLNRDQVRLTYAGISLSANDKDFDKLKILEDILISSMVGKLYVIRQNTGLFYSIKGSLTKNCGSEAGYIYISTLANKENLKELEKQIENLLINFSKLITKDDVNNSKNVLLHSFVNKFDNNEDIINTLLSLENQDYDENYFIKKANEIKAITLNQVKILANKLFNKNNIFKVRIGNFK